MITNRTSPAERLRPLFDRFPLADRAIRSVGVDSVGVFRKAGLFLAAGTDPNVPQVKQTRSSRLDPVFRRRRVRIRS